MKMVNIFRNLNGICDFTFAMHSYDHEENFQLDFFGNPVILQLKNEDENFPVFRRGHFRIKQITCTESSAFSEFKYVFGVTIRPGSRPIIAANHSQLTTLTISKNREIRGCMNSKLSLQINRSVWAIIDAIIDGEQ